MSFSVKYIFISILLSVASFHVPAQSSASDKQDNTNKEKIKWYSLEEANELNKVNKRKILVDLYTDWCGWCKVMDKNTFNNQKVIQYINKKFYPVKLNAEIRESIIFKNKTYKYVATGNRGYNEIAMELTGGRLSYPCVIFIDEEQNIIQAIPGYLEPDKFSIILSYFGEEHYKDTPWHVYEKEK